MKKLCLNLSRNVDSKLWINRLEEILGLSRKFLAISADSGEVEKASTSLVKIASVHGSHVQMLKLINFRQNSLLEFRTILSSMPQLEELKIWNQLMVKQNKRSSGDIEPVVLKLLKSAKIGCADGQIFNCFTAPKLSYLWLQGPYENGIDPIITFLRSANNLKSLHVYKWSPLWEMMGKIHDDAGKSALKLKKLHVGDDEIVKKHAVHLLNFLKLQETSLEDLRIGSVPLEVFSEIFSNLANLTTLRFLPKEIPVKKEYYSQLAVN